MQAGTWFFLGAALLITGGGFLGVTQFLLLRWLKRFKQE